MQLIVMVSHHANMYTAKSRSHFALVLVVVLPLLLLHDAAAVGRRVGGRSQVKNVRENKEIQELGRYCVSQYNSKANGSEKLLLFSQVVEAETQVVSGFKYYLKILAATAAGAPKAFEAVVVVKPWLRSKELLHFAPSSSQLPATTK